MPEDIVAAIYLNVFKVIYPGLRGLIMAFTTPGLRKSCKVFHPMPGASLPFVVPGIPVTKKDLKGLEEFNRVLFPPYLQASRLLRSLLGCCSPARARVADDVILLDALMWGLVLAPKITEFVFLDMDERKLDADDADLTSKNAEYYVISWLNAVATNSKPYKQHVNRLTNEGSGFAFGLVQNYLLEVPKRHKKRPSLDGSTQTSDLMKNILAMVGETANLIGQLGAGRRMDEMRTLFKEKRREWKRSITTQYVCSDACDFRGRTVEETKLMRCSKCLCARYCSRECQKVAWKAG